MYCTELRVPLIITSLPSYHEKSIDQFLRLFFNGIFSWKYSHIVMFKRINKKKNKNIFNSEIRERNKGIIMNSLNAKSSLLLGRIYIDLFTKEPKRSYFFEYINNYNYNHSLFNILCCYVCPVIFFIH